MEHLINTRPDYVLTEVNKLGVKTTGIPMLQSLHVLVFNFCSLWLRFMALKSKSIDFVLASPQADLDVPVYMELPAGVNPIDVLDGDRR